MFRKEDFARGIVLNEGVKKSRSESALASENILSGAASGALSGFQSYTSDQFKMRLGSRIDVAKQKANLFITNVSDYTKLALEKLKVLPYNENDYNLISNYIDTKFSAFDDETGLVNLKNDPTILKSKTDILTSVELAKTQALNNNILNTSKQTLSELSTDKSLDKIFDSSEFKQAYVLSSNNNPTTTTSLLKSGVDKYLNISIANITNKDTYNHARTQIETAFSNGIISPDERTNLIQTANSTRFNNTQQDFAASALTGEISLNVDSMRIKNPLAAKAYDTLFGANQGWVSLSQYNLDNIDRDNSIPSSDKNLYKGVYNVLFPKISQYINNGHGLDYAYETGLYSQLGLQNTINQFRNTEGKLVNNFNLFLKKGLTGLFLKSELAAIQQNLGQEDQFNLFQTYKNYIDNVDLNNKFRSMFTTTKIPKNVSVLPTGERKTSFYSPDELLNMFRESTTNTLSKNFKEINPNIERLSTAQQYIGGDITTNLNYLALAKDIRFPLADDIVNSIGINNYDIIKDLVTIGTIDLVRKTSINPTDLKNADLEQSITEDNLSDYFHFVKNTNGAWYTRLLGSNTSYLIPKSAMGTQADIKEFKTSLVNYINTLNTNNTTYSEDEVVLHNKSLNEIIVTDQDGSPILDKTFKPLVVNINSKPWG